jgi:gamma-glutamyltranspeptidase / glutathione hydrolase
LSSMTPTIVLRDGKPFLVLGSPGSSKIITTVANVLMGVIDYGMNIQEAVNAPRFHNQWLPDVLNVERWFSPDTVHALAKMGYKVQIGLGHGEYVSPYWSDAECIAIDSKSGELLGASDGRNNGKAVGY